LVTRQKEGALADDEQLELSLSSGLGCEWTRVLANPIDTTGFQDEPYSSILRPRNLGVGDLIGNTLPEIVAAFGPSPAPGPICGDCALLRVACWVNSCIGDVTLDGQTNLADISAVLREFRHGGPPLDPNADLDKDGQVDLADLAIVLTDYGCECETGIVPPDPF